VVLKGGSGDVTKEMTAGLDRNREMIQHATELLGKKPEVYSLARLPPDLSFEETFQNMKVLLDGGLFGAFGASEMKRESLERAQKVGPLFYLTTLPVSYMHLIPRYHRQSLTFPELTRRSSQSPTSKLKSRSGPTNKTSKTSSPGPRKTRSQF
jgi:aryl-alcohol dehydrogenase-like predicted oxidoreductase